MRKLFWSLAVVSMMTLLAGCPEEVPSNNNNNTPTDVDGDGVTAADGDCDDNDATVYPGATEACTDTKDNNCNGVTNEGCEQPLPDTGTKPDTGGNDPDAGSPDVFVACPNLGDSKPCGAPGSTCKQTCEGTGPADQHWGDCKTAAGQKPETETDINNCGQCGNVCPTPLHAAAQCKRGTCGRGPCETGYFDFDREQTFGCEVQCNGKQCTNGTQNWTLTSEPLPEKGLVFQTFASGGSYGDKIQTNTNYTNMGTLGEPTPPGVNGSVESTNATHKNIGGFGAALRKE